MKYVLFFLIAVSLVFMGTGVFASEDCSRILLFNGKNLDGWTLYQCEAKADGEDLLIESGNGMVQSAEQYGDFIWEFEWKALAEDDWDSGFYFRYTEIPEGAPWPPRYQANLRKGLEGNVSELKSASSTGLIKERDWNQFKLTVQGTKAALEINGKPAWEAEGLEGPEKGYVAFQAEVPGGGKHRFRNVYLTPLDKKD